MNNRLHVRAHADDMPTNHTVFILVVLLEHGAGSQRLGGRAVLEDVAMETRELISHGLEAPPSRAPVLHGEQLGAQVMEPQHVGVGVVVTPVISEDRHTHTMILH